MKKPKLLNKPFSVIINIKSTFNNTLISISDLKGNVLMFNSAGSVGFKGSKRSTPYAAQVVAELQGMRLIQMGITTAKIITKGLGKGRNSSILGFKSTGLVITSIIDKTNMPHNGCRLKKQRRV